jgi:ribosomal peptide maturation radical SAM protein 1
MNVLFVNMPFSAIRPAIGVSLLKAQLNRMGVSSRVLYLNMRFARLVSTEDYRYVSDLAHTQSLAGDWVFSRSAFGQRDEADAAYFQAFAQRFGKYSATEGAIAILKRCRAQTEAFLQECLIEIDWQSYDVIGFTSTFTQHVASLALAQQLKQRFPHLQIVFGGANCEAEMGLQLHRLFSFVDFVCSGEADISFPRLIQALNDGGDITDIAGVISRIDGESHYRNLAPDRVQDMNCLPYPDYDDYFAQLASMYPSSKQPVGVLMESSRGCWWGEKHHCTFCGLNGTTMTFRSKSAVRVLEEITSLCERYHPGYVEMVDNILDMRYFRDLLPELQKRGLQLGLFYETKANLTKEQIYQLHRAGVNTIQPGIESLSTDILRIMRKGTSAIQNIQLLKWCKEIGIKVYWNLLYGFPAENPADYESTAEIIESIHHLQPPFGLGAIRLDRFSPNFVSANHLGLCNIRPDGSYQHIYGLPESELFDLAYYFEHDYQDGRCPENYVGGTHKAVRRWYEVSENRGLMYVDHVETLAIWDFRACAKRTLTLLSGFERALYLYCDHNRSFTQIETFSQENGNTDVSVEKILESLLENRHIIHLDGRYLSLAIRTVGKGSNNKGQTVQ